MAITTLAQSGYIPWGVRKIHIVPTISNMASPTSLELGTATDITPQLVGYDGFTQAGSTIDSQSFVGPPLKLAGPPTLADSTITCRASATSADDIRSVLTDGQTTYVVVYPEGKTTGLKMDVFKVQVNGAPTKSTDPGAVATVTVDFALIATPQFNVTIP